MMRLVQDDPEPFDSKYSASTSAFELIVFTREDTIACDDHVHRRTVDVEAVCAMPHEDAQDAFGR